MKKLILGSVLLLVLSGCGNAKEKELTEKSSRTKQSSTSMSLKETSTEMTKESSSISESSDSTIAEVVTAESLMADYPQWTLESGQTPVEYNEARKKEVNQRLRDNGLPEDDDYINRNPVILTRDDEKAIRKNVGHMDYTPMEANVVLNGVMIIE